MKNTEMVNKKITRGINDPKSPRLLPLKKASEILGISLYSLRERVWAGQIPVIRFSDGGKQYIDSKDLEKFIQRHKERIL